MASDPRGGITRAGSAGAFSYASKPSFGNKPVNFVSFYDTLRFANWLHNGQPQGLQASSSTEDGAYTFAGPNTVGVRNAGAKAWLPSEDEWYKAAYYDPAKGSNGGYWRYPTRRDETPALATTDANGTIINDANNVANYAFSAEWNGQIGHVSAVGSAGTGSYSYYGVADLGGNVAEWNESSNGLSRGVRGGSWADFESALESVGTASQSPLTEVDTVGFRVARP
jgi:formylglycine-generating enzyme required for sulfatase activity